jgi:hypothetical protein
MNETNCERGEGGATERHRQVRREEHDRLGHTRGGERRWEAMRGGGCERGAGGVTERHRRDRHRGAQQRAKLPNYHNSFLHASASSLPILFTPLP